MTTATRRTEPEFEPAGGISGGLALFLVLAYFVGAWITPDASLIATILTGVLALIVPAVLLAALLLSAGAHRPRRRHHSHRRHY